MPQETREGGVADKFDHVRLSNKSEATPMSNTVIGFRIAQVGRKDSVRYVLEA